MNLVGRKFNNPRLNIDINVYEIDGKKWFIGKDIATILGYTNVSTAVSENVKPTQRKKIYVKTIENIGSSVMTKNANVNMITEIGVYQLVMKSRRPEAEEFQEWVHSEVLPSINNKGGYIDKKYSTNKQIDDIIDEAIEIKRQRDNLENGIRFNKKFKCDLKNYLMNLYPNIEDVYEQFIENMKVSGMLDEKGIPTDKFMEYNQAYNMFEHIIKVSNKINVRLRLTNLGYINLAKRIYEKDGKIYLNKNYEREE